MEGPLWILAMGRLKFLTQHYSEKKGIAHRDCEKRVSVNLLKSGFVSFFKHTKS